MKVTVISYFTKFFSGSERTVVVKKNIIGSFIVKGLSMLVSLFLVPYTIHLLGQEKYGIWITIFSIVTWFNMLDIGLGNGFRNKFAEAVALDNNKLAKDYVGTLYSSMAVIAIAFFMIFSIANHFVNWNKILNVSVDFDENLNLIAWSVFALFCLQLYFKNISTILLSFQKTTYSNMVIFLGNVGSLLLIFIFQKLHFVSLFSIALAFMAAPIIVLIIATLLVFSHDLKELKPNFLSLPQKKYFNDLIGLGLKFFFIQITTIVMFASSNIIITQIYGPAEVTPYNVAFRLYSSVQAIFSIIITPFWSAFTEANVQEDFNWIKKSIKKLISIWAVFSVGTIILWLVSSFVFEAWVGKEVIIPYGLSFQFAAFVIITTWTTIFVTYINGVGKIRLQLYMAIFQFITNIPLAIVLARYVGLNTVGIILAININMLLPAVVIPIQYKKLINQIAYGAWGK